MRRHVWESTGDYYAESNPHYDRVGIRCARCGAFRKIWKGLSINDPTLTDLECKGKMSKHSGLAGTLTTVDVPAHWVGAGKNCVVVRINGELTWVTPEKMNEYNQRKADLKGDWSWEQEVQLARIQLARKRMDQDEYEAMVTRWNERYKQNVGVPPAVLETEFDYRPWQQLPKTGVMANPSYQEPREKTKLDELKSKRNRWAAAGVPAMLLFVIGAYTFVQGWPEWAQWFWGSTIMPLAIASIMRTLTLNLEIVSVTRLAIPTPAPTVQLVRKAPQSSYDYYRQRYIETGTLMYKFMMEDAYAREHEHDFDVEEM